MVIGKYVVRFKWERYANLNTGWRGKIAPLRHMLQRVRGWWPRRHVFFDRDRVRAWYTVGPIRIVER